MNEGLEKNQARRGSESDEAVRVEGSFEPPANLESAAQGSSSDESDEDFLARPVIASPIQRSREPRSQQLPLIMRRPPGDIESALAPDDSDTLTCFHPGRLFILRAILQHSGTAGYSLENALVYANTGYLMEESAGLVDSPAGFVAGMTALGVATGILTLGNYASYLVIMDKFLEMFSCFSRNQPREMLPLHLNQTEEVEPSVHTMRFWALVAVIAALLKSGISSFSLYQLVAGVLMAVFTLESPWPTASIVGLVGLGNLLATVAFFNQGSAADVVLEEDADFDDEDEADEAVEMYFYQNATSGDSGQLFSIDHESDDNAPRRAPGSVACLSRYDVLRFYGASSYALQNAALYTNSGHQVASLLRLYSSPLESAFTVFSLVVGTTSVTLANNQTYRVIMGNYLTRTLGMSSGRDSDSADSAHWRRFWLANTAIATVFKVGVSAFTLYGIFNRVLYGEAFTLHPASVAVTTGLSVLNVLATVGLFSQQMAQAQSRPRLPQQAVALLLEDISDDSGDDSSEVAEKAPTEKTRLV